MYMQLLQEVLRPHFTVRHTEFIDRPESAVRINEKE